ncbi:iron-sulfur cluster assembly protein [Winogradskyella sediminis]|uniref:Iron-sulfur cluster assembly protein n=2 Tax=Winogradskyella sediminis TaxID=1382466 RepID=A0A1H1RHQ9_9FLAO|nr:iron-sulfur cluster assembly protein [Winogradskyella sediminis]SDS34429.1 iron-sulfur cluster assembly protein [Winogradskyella sediminis]
MKPYANIMLVPMVKPLLYRIFAFYLEQILLNDMIKVSDHAKNKVIELMTDDGYDPSTDYVRVGVKSGGCSGLSYDLKFDKIQAEDDKVFEANDIKIIVDKKSFLYLIGTTLEYSGGLNGTGFVFNNPNANRTCGCGESFSL